MTARGPERAEYHVSFPSFLERLATREQRSGILPADQLRTSEDRAAQYARLEQMIGSTPLIKIPTSNGSTIWAKVESENPTESHYDRATLTVLKRLEDEGLLKAGDTIVEGSSGSAGRSFAYYCNRLGFKLDMILPLPAEFPEVRSKNMEAFGANTIRADKLGGIGQVTRKFRRVLAGLRGQGYTREDYELEGTPVLVFRKGTDTIVAPNHSEIDITPRAFGEIAREAVGQLPEGVQIDTFIGTLGNGATMKGISEVLKERFGAVEIIGTEYQSSPTNAIRKLRMQFGDEETVKEKFFEKYGYRMPGKEDQTYHDSYGASTPGYEPPFVEVETIDHIVVMGDEWRDFKRRHNIYALLNNNVANLIGNTTAENLYVAEKLAELGRPNRNIFVVFYDKADQYPDWPPEKATYTYPLPVQSAEPVPYSLRDIAFAA